MPGDAVNDERRKRRIERFLIGFLAIGLLALLGVGIVSYRVLRQGTELGDAVVHAYRVQVAVGVARQLIEQTEDGRRGYAMTRDPLALRSWRGGAADLPAALARVDALLVDPAQRRTLSGIASRVSELYAQQVATNALAEAGRVDAAIALYRAQHAPALFRPLRRDFASLQLAERAHIGERTAARGAGVRLLYASLAITALLVSLLAIVQFAILLRYTRAIGRSRSALRRLNDTLEDEVAERTADLRRANEEIQRFAYIVSHDLRSPLVNVMGFTAELAAAAGPLGELVDRVEAEAPTLLTPEARLAVREDLPESVGFIRASTQKMDRLINAILKLSREGRRTVVPERLDLMQIAEAAVAAIQHLVEDRGVAVTVAPAMPPLTSDRLAIEQILSNLIENATKYLKAGRPGRVAVSAERTARGRVVVSVADNGRGIDPADHQRIFDLFRRSGAQDQPGEGIGLAHVRALAYRLGGTIDVESTLGEGATFRLDLPAVYQAPSDAKDTAA